MPGAPVEIGGIAADHDRQGAGGGAADASRDRRIEKPRPRSLSLAATRCEAPGSIVDMSTQRRPEGAAERMPAAPR